jgi:heptosyltransferase I
MVRRGNQILRFLDFYLGIPLIWTLGKFKKRKRNKPDTVNHIGILATAAIGDTVLMSAVLQDVRERYPEGRLTIFAGSSNIEIVRISCPYDEAVPINTANIVSATRAIRKHGPLDIWIDFGPWPRLNALLTYMAPAKFTIGFESLKQYRHYVYDQSVPHRNNCHELDNLRRLVSAIGVASSRIPALPTYDVMIQEDLVIVHMFPGGFKAHFKEWSTPNWVRFLNSVTERGMRVVLTGTADDRDRAERVRSLCENTNQIINMAGSCSLQDVCRLLQSARLVVSVNTGIMHIAAAYQCYLIALHGPTSVTRWGPLDDHAVNLCATSPSAGCLHLGFEYDKNDSHSLDTILPEIVVDVCYKVWKETEQTIIPSPN